jgi:hypothetical protein
MIELRIRNLDHLVESKDVAIRSLLLIVVEWGGRRATQSVARNVFFEVKQWGRFMDDLGKRFHEVQGSFSNMIRNAFLLGSTPLEF